MKWHKVEKEARKQIVAGGKVGKRHQGAEPQERSKVVIGVP